MNRKQYEKVKHLENNFFTAVNNGYTRAIGKQDMNTLLLMYREIEPDGEVHSISCRECLLMVLKRIGEDFYKYKRKLEKNGTQESDSRGTREEGCTGDGMDITTPNPGADNQED